jgi:hypothetical protein
VKKLRFAKVYFSDCNVHYILQESRLFAASENGTSLDLAEIKKISKNDAAKPLFIEHE